MFHTSPVPGRGGGSTLVDRPVAMSNTHARAVFLSGTLAK
jgi:hypothetical protein